MHCAMVKVLPDPVTPSSTCDLSPRFNPSTSSSIARDWSPRRVKSVTRLKRSYFDAIEQKIVPHGGGRSGRRGYSLRLTYKFERHPRHEFRHGLPQTFRK